MTLDEAIAWTKKNTSCPSTRERLKSRAACFALYQEILRLEQENQNKLASIESYTTMVRSIF